VNLPPYKRKTAMVFQDLALFPNMTVSGNILYGMDGEEHGRRLGELIELFRLRGLEDRLPSELSGGQRQRTALARTFACEPELVLMDEPFSSLDLPLRRNLRREIRLLQKAIGTPVLYVTHDVEDIFSMGKTVFFLKDGQLIRQVESSDLMSPGKAPELFQFLDIGTRVSGLLEFSGGRIHLVWPEGRLVVPGASVEDAGLGDGDRAAVIIAPEDVKLLYPDIPVDPRLLGNTFSGAIVDRGFSNGMRSLHLESSGLLWQTVFGSRSYTELLGGNPAGIGFGVDTENAVLFPA